MGRDILAIDVGTTALKMGVFSPDWRRSASPHGDTMSMSTIMAKRDIEPEKWWQAIKECCAEFREHLSSVGVVGFPLRPPA